jgi:hypothetical protein
LQILLQRKEDAPVVKFSLTTPDGPVLGLGISEENVQRLRRGKPIVVHIGEVEDLGDGTGRVVLFYGQSEEQMLEDFKHCDPTADDSGEDVDPETN